MYGDGALTFVLQKVTQALTDKVNVKAGAGYELYQLQNELRLMKCFLKDSSESEKTEVFIERERQIREIVYEVEDTIDTYLTNKAVAKTKNFFSRLSTNFDTQMEQQVKSLREKDVRPIMVMIEANFGGIQKPLNQIKTDQLRRKPSTPVLTNGKQFNNQDKVVDFLDEATVVEYLMESKENQLDVIAITGMPGLGKTTFARKILGHQSVISKFEFRIWVHVSEKFDYEDACLDILRQIAPRLITPIPSYDDLSDTVCGCLKEESFLLVADDVWTEQDWDKINEILPKLNGKGKVLVTTREKDVAAQVNNSRLPHELKGLGEKEGLELLKLKVFGNVEDCPPELEEIGKDIVDKCRGVPLTILVVGGVLRGLSTLQPIPTLIEKWLEVSENVSGILKKDEKNTIKNAIELSYMRLMSDELRLCFLYTALFPENQEISTSTLTQLWIAEGFVQKVEGESLEKTAEKILDTLINTSLLMITRKSPDQVKTCRVHDMMRGFCRTKAMKENLFREIKKSDGEFDPPLSEVPNFRRLCFNSNPTEFLSERWEGPRVRSFLCLSKESVDLDPTHISTISNAFKKLRVLNCKFINFQQFPEVQKLELLKHVTLSMGNLQDVPEEISQLVHLQTLIVVTKSHSITVKANIWKMIQLRRLKTKATILLDDKCWKGHKSTSCKTLQTISRLSHESCKASIPERAPNLKVLAIQGKVADLFSTLKMEKLGQLEKLKLVNDQSTASDNPLLLNPQHCFPPMLKSLTLSNTYLKWKDHMPILTKIDSLKVLKLKDNAFTGIDWDATVGDATVGGFPRLRFLLIENTKLVNWKASTAYFPSLTWLVVKNCKDLLEIPESLGRHLEKLEIERVDKSVADSAKKIESDKQTEQIPNPRWKVPFKLTMGPGCGY